MREEVLPQLIEAAKAGDSDALTALSKVALGGNDAAREAVEEIDSSDWSPTPEAALPVLSNIAWPERLGKDGKKGPKKGDHPLHDY